MEYKTLSRNYHLRKKGNGDFILFDKKKVVQYTISQKLFSFLYLFKNKGFVVPDLLECFRSLNIGTEDITSFLVKEEFVDIFTSDKPFIEKQKDDNIYHRLNIISPYTEYTPERIDFLITKHCNLNCKHCFENASPAINNADIDIPKLFNLFVQMDELNVKTLKITGGEPFSYPNIDIILDYISNLRFDTIILTNGMLLTEKLVSIINKGFIKLGISLDGITAESHDFLRGNGSFSILTKKLKMLVNSGSYFCITTSVNRNNFNDIESIAKYVLEELGAKTFYVNQLKPLGRAQKNNGIFLTEKEYFNIIDRVNTLKDKYGTRIEISDDAVLEEFSYSSGCKMTDETPIVCSAGNNHFSIDSNLNVFPCVYGHDFPDYIMGNLSSQSILEVWKSSKWDAFRGKTKLKDIKGCSTCKNNNSCVIKNCRLKAVYEGKPFYSHVSYCNQH